MPTREWLRLVSHPLFPSMTRVEIDFVTEAVKKVSREFSTRGCTRSHA